MAPLLRQPLLVALLLAEQAPATCCAANVVAPGAQLQKLVDGAIAAGARRLVVPPGDYLFNTTQENFQVHGAEQLQIDATGATVWLWPGSFVDIRDSRRSTIRGLTVDFSPPCFSQGSVTAVSTANRSFELSVEDGFLPPDLELHPQFNSTEVKIIYWSSTTRRLLPQLGSNPWDPTLSHCAGSLCTIVLGDRGNPLPAVGDLVTASPRIGANMVIQTWYTSGYRSTNCSQISTLNVRAPSNIGSMHNIGADSKGGCLGE